MRIRLVRKLAERLNGIDVSLRRVGDVIDLPSSDAKLLVAEGWARPVLENEDKPETRAQFERNERLSRF